MKPSWAHFFLIRVRARIAQAEQEGFRRTTVQLLGVPVSLLLWLALLPITIVLHLAGFRRLTVLAGRIGHLAAEPDSFLKARALGMIGAGRHFILVPRGGAANSAMLDYWRPHIPVIEHRLAYLILGAMSSRALMRHDMSRYVLKLNASQEIYRINAAWDGRAPLLTVSQGDLFWSDERFVELGLPRGAWFVCVHVREPGFSPADEAVHAHRNADPRAVRAAVEEIVRRGGWCVRMGDPSMTPMDLMPGLIDYAHHRLRCQRLDVLLCARARFFFGNTSGLALVSSAFGVPCALVNLIPMSVLAVLPGDLAIHKLHRLDRESRMLRFDEILGSPVGDFRYAKLYADAGITPIENTCDEIFALVCEMLDRLEGRFVEKPEDQELQKRFMGLFRPGHYSYGAASRVGAAFLRKHRDLLAT
jgi:putative glycosyltransferase (TIGR04372 family)